MCNFYSPLERIKQKMVWLSFNFGQNITVTDCLGHMFCLGKQVLKFLSAI